MQRVRRAVALNTFFVLVLAAVCGCGSTPTSTGTGNTAAALDIVSGDEQTAAPGHQLTNALVVEAVNNLGAPVSGVGISWTVASGAGSLSSTSVNTDANGRAQVTWILGSELGSQTVTASAGSNLSVIFVATAVNQ